MKSTSKSRVRYGASDPSFGAAARRSIARRSYRPRRRRRRGGTIFEYDGNWTHNQTPTGENLQALARGATDIVVGAGGELLER